MMDDGRLEGKLKVWILYVCLEERKSKDTSFSEVIVL